MSKQRKYKWRLAVRLFMVALLMTAALTTLTVLWKRHPIETRLTQQAYKTLLQNNLPAVNIYFEGRDGTVSGFLPDETNRALIVNTLAQLDGVRLIHNQLQLSRPEQGSKALRAPQPQTSLQASQSKQAIENLDFSEIHFQAGTAKLPPSAHAPLNLLVAYLQEQPNTNIEIAVHTDSHGTTLGQITVSQARAEAIRHYLVNQGIELKRLQATGYGATQPRTAADTLTADQASSISNQRVEVSIMKE